MSETGGQEPAVTEVVGRFADGETFKAAVAELRDAGFQHSDLSVLDTHVAISASEPPSEAWKQSLAGLVGEVKYVGPLTTAGLIAIATGQVGMAVAAVMAAGITGVALRELLEDIKATPHTEDFARALEGGAVLLWVTVANAESEAKASEILARHGAADIHRHQRAVS